MDSADDVWEFFNERSAIMQHDGGQCRSDADFAAYVRTRQYFAALGVSIPLGGYFSAFASAELGWSDAIPGVIVFPCAATLAHMACSARDEADRDGRFYTYLIAHHTR
ncbi:conserved protein of unknown function [Burkholderia multivorans]